MPHHAAGWQALRNRPEWGYTQNTTESVGIVGDLYGRLLIPVFKF
jgi:hypothetical protein